LELNSLELRYFSTALREKVFKTSGINPLKLNLDWPTVKQLGNKSFSPPIPPSKLVYLDIGSWPPANPNWFLQQEAIAKLWPAGQQGFAQLFGGAAFGAGGGVATGAPAGQAAAAAPVEEVKEEKVEVKQ